VHGRAGLELAQATSSCTSRIPSAPPPPPPSAAAVAAAIPYGASVLGFMIMHEYILIIYAPYSKNFAHSSQSMRAPPNIYPDERGEIRTWNHIEEDEHDIVDTT
jgi:hypothetical protein